MQRRWLLFLGICFFLSCGEDPAFPDTETDLTISGNSFPGSEATGIPVDTSFHIRFERALNAETIRPLSVVLIHQRDIVPTSLSYNNNTATITLTPVDPLQYTTQYTLSVPSVVEDLRGNRVEGTSWTFTTEDIPEGAAEEVIASSPEPQAENIEDNPIAEEIIEENPTAMTATPLSSTRYRATFNATWSSATHPADYPANAHFSGLIGMTHQQEVNLFEPGQAASPGIKDMAELGSKTNLTSEVNTFIDAGSGGHLISGGGIGTSPGMVSVEFDITPDHPYVTITSMLAPSPDWFIAIRGINMIADGQWVESTTLPVAIYDAGTDSGTSYSSPNAVTSPAENISVIVTPPLASGGTVASLGTIQLTKINQ